MGALGSLGALCTRIGGAGVGEPPPRHAFHSRRELLADFGKVGVRLDGYDLCGRARAAGNVSAPAAPKFGGDLGGGGGCIGRVGL